MSESSYLAALYPTIDTVDTKPFDEPSLSDRSLADDVSSVVPDSSYDYEASRMGISNTNIVDNIVEDARCDEGHGSRPSSRASSRPSSRASAASSEASSGIGAARSLASSTSRASSKKLGILQSRNETPTSAGGDTMSVYSHRSDKSGTRSGYSGHTGSTGHSSKTDTDRSHNTQLTNEDAAKAYDQILSYCDKDGAYAPTPPRTTQRAPSFVSAYSAAPTVQGTIANAPEDVDDDDDAVIQESPSLIVEKGVKKLEGIAEKREKEEAHNTAFQKQQEGEDAKSEDVGDKKSNVKGGNVIAVRLPTDRGEPTESVTYMGPIPGHRSRGKLSFAKLKSKRLFGSKKSNKSLAKIQQSKEPAPSADVTESKDVNATTEEAEMANVSTHAGESSKIDKSPPPSPTKEVLSIASKEALVDETGEMPRVGSNAGESVNTNVTETVTLDSTDPDVVEVTINEEVDTNEDGVLLNKISKDAEEIEVFDLLVPGDTFESIQKQSTDNNVSVLQQLFSYFQCDGDTSIEKPELFGVTSGELVLLYEDEVDEQLDIEVINDKNNVARIGFYGPSPRKKEKPKAEEAEVEEKEAPEKKEPEEKSAQADDINETKEAAQADDIDVAKEAALADEIDEVTKLPSEDTQEENTDESEVVEPMKVESKVILKTKVVPGVEVVSDGQNDVVVDSVAVKIGDIAEKLEHRRKEQGALKSKKTSVRMKFLRKIKSKKTKKKEESKGILDKVEVNYTIEDAPKGSKRKWKSKPKKKAAAEEKEVGPLCGELTCGGGEDDLDEPFNDVYM